ncbi:unnamed protein product [Durusdinium trenchii]|uniref:Uncharacterized protein n=1 Tax=Durusdinium trenchii TaxID=1381693 RepID=A0ABP0NZ88_9DINO
MSLSALEPMSLAVRARALAMTTTRLRWNTLATMMTLETVHRPGVTMRPRQSLILNCQVMLGSMMGKHSLMMITLVTLSRQVARMTKQLILLVTSICHTQVTLLLLVSQELVPALIGYIFKDRQAHSCKERFAEVTAALKDALIEPPASSVEVEKQRANFQVDANVTKANTKRPLTLQLDSYILSCLLEHRRFTEHLEKQCWGADHSKVLRWMKGRMVDSTAPTSKLSLRKTSELNSAGTVKRRPGLLKGLLLEA